MGRMVGIFGWWCGSWAVVGERVSAQVNCVAQPGLPDPFPVHFKCAANAKSARTFHRDFQICSWSAAGPHVSLLPSLICVCVCVRVCVC